ncbi:hypothetical protein EF513_06195 [Rickettsiales endosymbiont of Stachyamoeba lipophora]|nr:hypothetical protein EF513_06195 [Rickettsiales endosymbiont of Stachyamoeba lipophora]
MANCNFKTPFHIAITVPNTKANKKIIILLLKALKKANVNIKDFLNQEVEHFVEYVDDNDEHREEGEKFTALLLAAMFSRLELIPLLIKLGVDEKAINIAFNCSLKDIYRTFNRPSGEELKLFDQKINKGIALREQEQAYDNIKQKNDPYYYYN